ncbi:MAG: CDP-alcohol phosphatidyltransferase family protein [Patescibacteria group bacterium]
MEKFFLSLVKFLPSWLKPNHLSIIRILMIFPILFFLYTHQNIIAFFLFLLAVFLDIMDGVLARARFQITKIGEWLDPLADKLLILSILLTYAWHYLPHWLIIILLILEMIIVLGRPIKIKLGKQVSANMWGKIKMGCESVAILSLLIAPLFLYPIVILFLLLSICFAFLSLLSHILDIYRT